MKSILLFMPYGGVGGMERLAFTFYKKYKALGYKVTAVKIIGLMNDVVNFGDDEIVLSRKDFCDYSKFDRLRFYISIPFLLKDLCKKHKIDYIISFGDMANCFSALTKYNAIKVASIHSLKSVEMSNPSMMDKIFIKSYKYLYNRFNKVVCISKGIKEDLKINFNYPHDNLRVIYNPHDLDFIKKCSEEPIDENESVIFDKDTIVFLGRLTGQKSPWHLINSFYKSNNSNKNLVFIGDGSENITSLLNNQIRDLGLENKVFFLGRKNNPYKYLAKANLLALSSLYEGTPNVIVEAIMLEVPVISSYCTEGIMEMMSLEQRNEKDGLIFTESGIITPNFFKGSLSVPDSFEIIEEEIIFAKAIDVLFSNYDEIKGQLLINKKSLVAKYDINNVCKEYLEAI